MLTYAEFSDAARRLEDRVRLACDKCGRKFESVKILPVTKNHTIEAANFALKYGFDSVGENRVQEALTKMPFCPQLNWELIGHLQTNKAVVAAQNFSRIQSVDTQRLLKKLDDAAKASSKILPVLLQINSGNDPAKFGADLEDADALLEYSLRNCSNIKVEGLMAIAELTDDESKTAKCFSNLRKLAERWRKTHALDLPELSMGMSDDLDLAIAEGSTMIRIGTALFGERSYK